MRYAVFPYFIIRDAPIMLFLVYDFIVHDGIFLSR